MTRTAIVIAAVLALAAMLPAVPAQAQRVFVSATGSDSNPCTFASPCRGFQHAHDVAAAGGEIDVLDPAGYGALTIGKSISIQGHGFSGITVASGANGITINAPSSSVINLRGLLIDGAGVGTYGIQFNVGASLNVQDCVIRNLDTGIDFFPSTASKLFVSDTIVSDNPAGVGILVLPNGSVSIAAFFNHVEVDNNGAGVSANSSQTYVAIRDSSISGNVAGVVGQSSATVRLSHSTITGNGTGWAANTGGTVSSTRDNLIDNNTLGNGAPTLLSYE
jgi:nitrous oxidase accessory protein NosD